MQGEDFAFKYPPDLELCLIHRKANRMFRSFSSKKESNYDRCACCGRFLAEKSHASSLCYDVVEQLDHLGPGIPLIFIFMQNVILTIFTLIAVVGIYALVSNAIDDSCQKLRDHCASDSFNNISISNKLLNTSTVTVQVELVLATTLIWVIIHQISLYRCRKTQIVVDRNKFTPSDFSILIKPLPHDATKYDITNMILKKNHELDNLTKDRTDFLKIYKVIIPKKQKLYLKERKLQEDKFKMLVESGEQDSFKHEEIKRGNERASVAIIIFSKSIAKQYFLTHGTIVQQVRKLLACDEESQYKINNEYISIQRAPQPDDIIWKNIDKTNEAILKHKVLTVMFGIALLALGGFIQYWLAKWQLVTQDFSQKVVSVFSSAIIMLTNFIIRYFLVWVTKFEGNITFTMQSRSINFKLCYFQFLNAGIFYTLANILAHSFTEYKITQSLSLNVTTFMIMNAISPTAMTIIFDYFELPNCIYRYFLKQGYRKYTQKQANEIYEYPSCDVPSKYAYVIKTLLLTCFYTPFVPIVAPISLIGLILYYFVIKLLFRYCYTVPKHHSNQINIGSNRLLTLAPLALNFGQLFIYFYIMQRLDINIDTLCTILVYTSLGCSCLFIVVPWLDINLKLFPLDESAIEDDYSMCEQSFEITYEKADPLYQCIKESKISKRDYRFALKQCKIMKQIPQSFRKAERKMTQTLHSERMLNHLHG